MPDSGAEFHKLAGEIFQEAKEAFLNDFPDDISERALEETLARADEYPKAEKPFWVGLTEKVLKRWSPPATRRIRGPLVRLPGLIRSPGGRRPGVWWKATHLQVVPREAAGRHIAHRFAYRLLYLVAFQGGGLPTETPTQYRHRRQELSDALQVSVRKLRNDPQLSRFSLVDLFELYMDKGRDPEAQGAVRSALDQLREALPEGDEPADPYAQLTLDGPRLADVLELLGNHLPEDLEDPHSPEQRDPKFLTPPARTATHLHPQERLLGRRLCQLFEEFLGVVPPSPLKIVLESATGHEVDPEHVLRDHRRNR